MCSKRCLEASGPIAPAVIFVISETISQLWRIASSTFMADASKASRIATSIRLSKLDSSSKASQ